MLVYQHIIHQYTSDHSQTCIQQSPLGQRKNYHVRQLNAYLR